MLQIPHDFPPVPKCFSHLLNENIHPFYDCDNESEDQTLSQSLPANSKHIHEFNSRFVRSLSENSHSQSQFSSPGSDCNMYTLNSIRGGSLCDQEVFLEDDPGLNSSQNLMFKYRSALPHSPILMSLSSSSQKRVTREQSSFDIDKIISEEESHQDLSNPFIKLNSSLEKLRNEMRDLRLFDVSLFYQLLSVHESIQDLKLNLNDRFSETASECSLGSASCMGSMSSLDEESDWGDSQIFMQSHRGEESADDDENRQSTSSLLKQIAALTQKAEEDI